MREVLYINYKSECIFIHSILYVYTEKGEIIEKSPNG